MKKRLIVAASAVSDELQSYIDNLDDEAYHNGYELSSQDESGNLVFTAIDDKDLMPTILVKREDDGEDVWFTPTMKFPEKLSSDDVDYADSFEYYMEKWVKASKFCTYLLKNHYTVGMYED